MPGAQQTALPFKTIILVNAGETGRQVVARHPKFNLLCPASTFFRFVGRFAVVGVPLLFPMLVEDWPWLPRSSSSRSLARCSS